MSIDDLFTSEETRVRRKAAFAYNGFDGPHTMSSDVFAASYAYCRICGAMVPLGHVVNEDDLVEVAIKLHRSWHAANDRPTYTPDEAVLLAMKTLRSTRITDKELAVIEEIEHEARLRMNGGIDPADQQP